MFKYGIINVSFILLTLCLAQGCAKEPESIPKNAIKIGLLIPFTGADAAVGSSFEHAALLARDTLNATGGVNGREIHFVTKDTHSNVDKALKSLDAILDEDVIAVIGPENAEIARAILPILQEHSIPLISPVISGASSIPLAEGYSWFRFAPSPSIMGRSLANFIYDDGVTELSAAYSDGDYNVEFITSLTHQFEIRGGNVVGTVHLSDAKLSYASEVAELLGSTHIAISASTELTARFLSEMESSSIKELYWYFSPVLETPVFPQNTQSGVLEDSLGIGLDVYNEDTLFIDMYEQRWGDLPQNGAYYYYDSIMFLGLSIALTHGNSLEINPVNIAASMNSVSLPTGIQIKWNDMENGFKYALSGRAISFAGLTGPLLFDSSGQQLKATLKTWTVVNGNIVENEN